MRGAKANRGFTLIEVMVASVLALLVLTLIFQLFLPALRAWSDGQRRAEVGQSLLVTSTWIGDDVVRSSPGSLDNSTANMLIMHCSLGPTDTADNPFNQRVVYTLEDGGDLYRSVKELVDGESPPLPTPAEVKIWKDRRRVGSNLTLFQALVPQEWRIELHMMLDKEGRKGEMKTGFASIYGPLDPAIAEATPTPEP